MNRLIYRLQAADFAAKAMLLAVAGLALLWVSSHFTLDYLDLAYGYDNVWARTDSDGVCVKLLLNRTTCNHGEGRLCFSHSADEPKPMPQRFRAGGTGKLWSMIFGRWGIAHYTEPNDPGPQDQNYRPCSEY